MITGSDKQQGLGIIVSERLEQIDNYGFTGEHHANHPEWYDKGQLIDAASRLAFKDIEEIHGIEEPPTGWDFDWWNRLVDKPHVERLGIAGALLAAEIDRLKYLEENEKP